MKTWYTVSRAFYPNWLSISYMSKGWGFFFAQEYVTITILMALSTSVMYLRGGVDLISLIKCFGWVVLYRRILAGGVCTSTKKLTNKNIIITGANVGIGKETARDFLKRGAHVILACRNLEKAEAARRDLAKEGGKVEVRQLDLASLKSIREFAAGIKKDRIKLHMLVNNAGVMECPYYETAEGFELQMGTNHLGHFLLTNLLLPQMQHGEPARIINVSSLSIAQGEINFDDFFTTKKGYDRVAAYANSKLANVLFTRQLAKNLKGSNIQCFSLHPGVVLSELTRHIVLYKLIDNVLTLIFKTTQEGIQTTLYCALEAEQHPNMYFSDCDLGWVTPNATDDKVAAKLWKVSADLVGLKE